MKSTLPQAFKQEKKFIFNKRFGVIFNGEDNLEPLITENAIALSPTASQCNSTYSSFLGGGGFAVDLSNINLSGNFWQEYTPEDLLADVCENSAEHSGAFILVGYNANYDKETFKVIPNSLCRLGKQDDDGYSGKVVVSPNGWGRSIKKEDVHVYDSYNPNPNVIQAQVERDGGWENYRGQILFFKLCNKYAYPVPKINGAMPFAKVEYKMGQYYEGVVDRSFENITFIRHRAFDSEEKKRNFYSNIKKLSGIDNADSKFIVEDDWDDEREKSGNIKFDTIPNDVKADKYAHFETSASNFIRKVYGIPPQLTDYVAGKLGNTSGEDLVKAQSVYNAKTAKDRNKIERLFKELFNNYKDNINPTEDWTINQYSLLDDGTVNTSNDATINQ